MIRLLLLLSPFAQDDLAKDTQNAIERLSSPKYTVSQTARAELIEIGAPAVDALVKALNDELDKPKKIKDLKAELAELKKDAAKNAARITEVEKLLAETKDSPQVRHLICEILGQIRQARPEAIAALTRVLRDDRAEYGTSVASAAAASLGWIGDRSAAPALIEVLKDERRVNADRQLKYEIIRALGLLRSKEAAETLRKALEDKKTTALDENDEFAHTIAAEAADALGKIRDEGAIDGLGKLLDDQTTIDPSTQHTLAWHAARALERIRGESKGNLEGDEKDDQQKPTEVSTTITMWQTWYRKDFVGKKNAEDTRKKIAEIDAAVRKFRDENKRLPNLLVELTSKPTDTPDWKGPYVKDDGKKTFEDGWGRPIGYNKESTWKAEGAEFDIWSYGADGAVWGGGVDADLYNHDKYVAALQKKNKEKLDEVVAAIQKFKEAEGRLPEKLKDLVEKPAYAKKWEKPYLVAEPADAFNSRYYYVVPGTEKEPYDLVSRGADKLPGGTGLDEDLWNHDKRPKEDKKDK